MTVLPDQDARAYAETTFDRNVVVLAGAGTGKTTLLVNRIVHALMREPRPYAVTEILALTFTNKAATQMKVRLRERLAGLMAAARGGPEGGERSRADLEELRRRYALTASGVEARAEAALLDLEKAEIGTLHSFAAHVLRLHPLESGVDPAFREDEGARFEWHFREQWDQWLCGELGPEGGRHARWRGVLETADLASVRELARSLASELVSLEDLRASLDGNEPAASVRGWLDRQQGRASALLTAYGRPKPRKVESLLEAAQTVIAQVASRGLPGLRDLDAAASAALARGQASQPTDWTDPDYAEAREVIRVAQRLLEADERYLLELVDLLQPFVERVRGRFLSRGWISFDGLLAGARRLLHDQPAIRERLKQTYKTILIDEFQDTDPVQYEIVLYLAEAPGRCSRSWEEIVLEPGKLFIVGDPKQSIYAFRRADIEAFHRVVDKVQASGGEVRDLVTNFRSDDRVLAVVNDHFDALFRPVPRVQPANVHLQAEPHRPPRTREPGVELRLVSRSDDEEEFDAAAASRAEAAGLARWLRDELLGREWVVDEAGREGPVRPGHVALLFRKLTQAQDYLDALRRFGIPYVTEGEKHFYRRQEVIDLVNVLRVLENPRDAIAFAGVLRSSLGGLTDRDLYELSQRQALDHRRRDRLAGWESPRAEATRRLYDCLSGLSTRVPCVPLPEALDQVLDRLPLLELAAASRHGEQAVANLSKVRRLALELADRPDMMLSGFVDELVRRLAEEADEGEEVLGEPSLDAVQVLTIHKAKGLEFPIVVLPGLHQGAGQGSSGRPVMMDWSSNTLGLSCAGRSSLGYLMAEQKHRTREEAEARRVLYVGMTRARERLVLSAGLPSARAPGRSLSLLEEAGWPLPDSEQDGGELRGPGGGRVVVRRAESLSAGPPHRAQGLRTGASWAEVVARWDARARRHAEARDRPWVVTPSSLGGRHPADARRGEPATGPEEALLVGTLVHRLLEAWDFAGRLDQIDRHLEALCRLVPPSTQEGRHETVRAEARRILEAFFGSPAYRELSRSEILGREVPLFFAQSEALPPQSSALSPQSCLISGALDLLYRLDGRLWVADYKTDRVPPEEIGDRVEAYRDQAQLYREAVARALGLEKVGCKLIFLRLGRAVEVE